MNLLLAQANPVEKLHLPPDTKGGLSLTWVFIAIGAVVLLAILWAVFIRRSPEKVAWGPGRSDYKPPSPDSGESASHGKRRRRRRRRDHRPRNPTLAETGGLPPVRTDSSSEPGD